MLFSKIEPHKTKKRHTLKLRRQTTISAFLLPNILIILLKRNTSRQRPISNFGGEPRPLLKLGNRHFLFHIPCVMGFVRAIISLPDRIVLAFFLITPFRTDIAAGLVRLVHKRLVAVCIIPRAADQKEFTAVLASVREVVLLQSVEEIIVQKRA